MHLTHLETLLAEHLPALRDLTNDLPRSGTWLLTMYCVVEAADLLDDEAVATDAYDMLRPFADRPVVAGPGAAREAAELGMALPVRERPRRSRPRRAVCRRQGVGWVVELGHHSARVADSVGMGYLATLLANPGHEIPCVELAAGFDPLSTAADGSGQPVLDAAALRAYRERLSTLRQDIEDLEARDDAVQVTRARAEFDWLVAELRAASGHSGRSRNFAGNAELARLSVGKAIRRALSRIETANPMVGGHLRASVETGVRCRYHPT